MRPGEEWKFQTAALTDGESGEVYLVDPMLWAMLGPELRPIVLVLTISRSSTVPFLWPCKLPGADGRPIRRSESALEAVKLAEQQWCRVASDITAGCYIVHVAVGELSEPMWPDMDMNELIRLAFRDRFIRELGHTSTSASDVHLDQVSQSETSLQTFRRLSS